MTMITPSYLGETIEYSSLHACRSTLEDPTARLATAYGPLPYARRRARCLPGRHAGAAGRPQPAGPLVGVRGDRRAQQRPCKNSLRYNGIVC